MLLKGLAQFRIYELVVLINKPFGAWLVGNYYLRQFCESGPGLGSAWIHIDLAVPDPDPYGQCGSGSGSRSKEVDQN